ncbi:glycosyltransferase family 4 protein, partial [Citrobacter braakii]|nr:glycosyltransferase family 4 protein [Citrobacter braakii]
YAWDLQHQYLRESHLDQGFKSMLVRAILHYVRLWDVRTAPNVDVMLANSRYIARRIEKCYGREAEVIYPPVDTSAFSLETRKQDFYLTASRLVPYKMIPTIAEAFRMLPDRKLVIIGDG